MLFITISSTEKKGIIGIKKIVLFNTFLPNRFWVYSHRSEVFPETCQCPFRSLFECKHINFDNNNNNNNNDNNNNNNYKIIIIIYNSTYLGLFWVRVVHEVPRLFIDAKVSQMDEVVGDGFWIRRIILSCKSRNTKLLMVNL